MHNPTIVTKVKNAQALVIGAGIAGLLAARVLADYYDQVLIVERDALPEQPEFRPGIPQAHHLHRLWPRGKMIMERLFPGFTSDLFAHGAYSLANTKILHVVPNGKFESMSTDNDLSCSRILLEWEIRQRVQMLPGVSFLTQREVLGLETTPDRTKVTGIRLRRRGQLDKQTTLQADLVVDASGRSSKIVAWMQALGYTVPDHEQVNAAIGYSTCQYQGAPDARSKWSKVMGNCGDTSHGRGAGLVRTENGTWLANVITAGGYYPPSEVPEFEQQLSQCLGRPLSDIMGDAKRQGEIRSFRVSECIRQHFEQMDEWPASLLVLGDALCHFDPIYGQGMTVAAIEAETLEVCCREQQSQPSQTFERDVLQRMQAAIHPAWWLSVIADLRKAGVSYSSSTPLKGVQLIQAYIDLYLKWSLLHDQELLQQGKMTQTYFFKYLLMNGLQISPREVINASTLAIMLTSGPASAEQKLLAALFQDYPERFEEMLDEAIPDFSLAFDKRLTLAVMGDGAKISSRNSHLDR